MPFLAIISGKFTFLFRTPYFKKKWDVAWFTNKRNEHFKSQSIYLSCFGLLTLLVFFKVPTTLNIIANDHFNVLLLNIDFRIVIRYTFN